MEPSVLPGASWHILSPPTGSELQEKILPPEAPQPPRAILYGSRCQNYSQDNFRAKRWWGRIEKYLRMPEGNKTRQNEGVPEEGPRGQGPPKTRSLMRGCQVISGCIYMTFYGTLFVRSFHLSQAKNLCWFHLSCDLPLHWTCVLKNPHLLRVKLIFVTQSAGLQRRLTRSQLQEQSGLDNPLCDGEDWRQDAFLGAWFLLFSFQFCLFVLPITITYLVSSKLIFW